MALDLRMLPDQYEKEVPEVKSVAVKQEKIDFSRLPDQPGGKTHQEYIEHRQDEARQWAISEKVSGKSDEYLIEAFKQRYPDLWENRDGSIVFKNKVLNTIDRIAAPVANVGYQGLGATFKGVGKALGMIPGKAGEALEASGEQIGSAISQYGYEQLNTSPEDISSKIGQIYGTIGAGAVFGGIGARVLSSIPLVSKVPIARFLARSAGSTTGIIAAQEGELPSFGELGLGVAIDTLMSLATYGVHKYVDAKHFIKKASGLTPQVRSKLSKMVSKKIDPITGKPFYTDIDDYMLKNGITGVDRTEMAEQAADLFTQAKASKEALLKGVKTLIPKSQLGQVDDVIKILQKEWSKPGNEAITKFLKDSLKKKSLGAVALERIRSLADDSLGDTFFKGGGVPAKKGLGTLMQPVREALESLDTTGMIAKANIDKQILYGLGSATESLQKALRDAANRNLTWSSAWRLTAGGAGAAGASTIPVVGQAMAPVIMGAAIIDAAVSIPQVASTLAKGITALTKSDKSTIMLIRGLIDMAGTGAKVGVKQETLKRAGVPVDKWIDSLFK